MATSLYSYVLQLEVDCSRAADLVMQQIRADGSALEHWIAEAYKKPEYGIGTAPPVSKISPQDFTADLLGRPKMWSSIKPKEDVATQATSHQDGALPSEAAKARPLETPPPKRPQIALPVDLAARRGEPVEETEKDGNGESSRPVDVPSPCRSAKKMTFGLSHPPPKAPPPESEGAANGPRSAVSTPKRTQEDTGSSPSVQSLPPARAPRAARTPASPGRPQTPQRTSPAASAAKSPQLPEPLETPVKPAAVAPKPAASVGTQASSSSSAAAWPKPAAQPVQAPSRAPKTAAPAPRSFDRPGAAGPGARPLAATAKPPPASSVEASAPSVSREAAPEPSPPPKAAVAAQQKAAAPAQAKTLPFQQVQLRPVTPQPRSGAQPGQPRCLTPPQPAPHKATPSHRAPAEPKGPAMAQAKAVPEPKATLAAATQPKAVPSQPAEPKAVPPAPKTAPSEPKVAPPPTTASTQPLPPAPEPKVAPPPAAVSTMPLPAAARPEPEGPKLQLPEGPKVSPPVQVLTAEPPKTVPLMQPKAAHVVAKSSSGGSRLGSKSCPPERRQETWRLLRQVELPQKRPEDNYELSEQGDDSEDEGHHRDKGRYEKFVPAWSETENFMKELERQANLDPDTIFGTKVPACDLEQVFPEELYRQANKTRPKRLRGSSQDWRKDKLTIGEVRRYKERMGQVKSWEHDGPLAMAAHAR